MAKKTIEPAEQPDLFGETVPPEKETVSLHYYDPARRSDPEAALGSCRYRKLGAKTLSRLADIAAFALLEPGVELDALTAGYEADAKAAALVERTAAKIREVAGSHENSARIAAADSLYVLFILAQLKDGTAVRAVNFLVSRPWGYLVEETVLHHLSRDAGLPVPEIPPGVALTKKLLSSWV
ncbi:MAG: hypothetical protein AB7F32_04035 [Victivallaceae bacterium]